MAASKTDKSSKPNDDAKTLNSSDLDPNELAKAIEKSVANESKPDKAEPAKKSEKPADKKDKTDTPKAEPKPNSEPADANVAEKSDEDKGVPIIVKRHSGYVTTPSGNSGKTEGSTGTKPLEPPSKTQKTLDPESEEKDSEEPRVEAEDQPVASDSPVTETKEESKPKEEVQPQKQPTDSKVQSAEAARVEGPVGTPAPVAPEGAKDPTAENKLQKPTVFDTTEYHLPIKTKNHKYVNSAVAWVVLTIALAVAAGYVLYRLGMVEFGDLRVLE